MYDQSIRFVIGTSADNFCDECYYLGFLNRMPEERHFCPDCNVSTMLTTVGISFETWKRVTTRVRYQEYSFEQFLECIWRAN